VKIISMSFGLNSSDDLIDECIADATKAKVILFAAAANHGNRQSVSYPAAEDQVICVNASDGNGKSAPFNPPPRSGFPNFSILGMNVQSTWPAFQDEAPEAKQKKGTLLSTKLKGTSKYMSGTSVATPIAAALTGTLFAYSQANVDGNAHSQFVRRRGVRGVLEAMSNTTQGFQDIVPWGGRFWSYRRRLSSTLEDILEQLERNR
jgi:subtilisin family serine protease